MKKSSDKKSVQALETKAIILKTKLLVLQEQENKEMDIFVDLRNRGLISKIECHIYQQDIRKRYDYADSRLEKDYYKTMLAYYQSDEYSKIGHSLHKDDYKASVEKLDVLIKSLRKMPKSKWVTFNNFRLYGTSSSASAGLWVHMLLGLKSAYKKSPKQYTVEDARILDRDPWMNGLNGIEWAEMKIG